MYLGDYGTALGGITAPTKQQSGVALNARTMLGDQLKLTNAAFLPLAAAIAGDVYPMSDGLVAFWKSLTGKSSSWLKEYRLKFGAGSKAPYPTPSAKSRSTFTEGDITFMSWLEPGENRRALIITGYNPVTFPAAVIAAANMWLTTTTADVVTTAGKAVSATTAPILKTITATASSAASNIAPILTAAVTAPMAIATSFKPPMSTSSTLPAANAYADDALAFEPPGAAWWKWALGGVGVLVVGGLVVRRLKKK